MLAMADRHGLVEASIPGLADMARVTIPEVKAALEILLAPDEYSRTTDREGRRIEIVDGGWWIINHGKYRAKMGADERREYLRIKQQEHRDRVKAAKNSTFVNIVSTEINNVNDNSTMSTHAEAESKAQKKGKQKAAAKPLIIHPPPFTSQEFTEAWNDWQQSRRESGKPLKPTTIKLQFRKLADMGEARAVAALKNSTAGGYQGIFEPNPGTTGTTGTNGKPTALNLIDQWEKEEQNAKS